MGPIKLISKFHGVHEWLLVRCSAILILVYLIYLAYFIFFNTSLSYSEWCNFFSNKTIKICSTLTLFAMLSHTWVGMHHILEDYIKKYILKKLGIYLIIIVLILYLTFGIIIIWSI